MTSEGASSKARRRRLVFLLAIVCVAAFAAVIVLLALNAGDGGSPSDGAYQAELEVALAGADADLGADLSETNECSACHLMGDGSMAPLFFGLANVAGQRRASLTAEQYLYEAIVYPSVHLVGDYTDSMPNNYGDRLTTQEIGHLIAFLLTFNEAQ